MRIKLETINRILIPLGLVLVLEIPTDDDLDYNNKIFLQLTRYRKYLARFLDGEI
jgi:hypothetical protein